MIIIGYIIVLVIGVVIGFGLRYYDYNIAIKKYKKTIKDYNKINSSDVDKIAEQAKLIRNLKKDLAKPEDKRIYADKDEIWELPERGMIFVRYSEKNIKKIGDRMIFIDSILRQYGLCKTIGVFGLHKDIELEKLNDKDLKKINLQRINTNE